MRVDLYSVDFSLTEAIVHHARRQVVAALRAARDRITEIVVRFTDINGPRGGIDKSCRIVARLDARRTLVAAATERDLYAAIDHAAGRLREALRRRLARARTLRREHSRCRTVPRDWITVDRADALERKEP